MLKKSAFQHRDFKGKILMHIIHLFDIRRNHDHQELIGRESADTVAVVVRTISAVFSILFSAAYVAADFEF